MSAGLTLRRYERPVDAVSASLAGINRATARFNRASADLVQGVSGASQADPADALVGQIEAKLQFKASVTTLRAADEMTQSLLDILV